LVIVADDLGFADVGFNGGTIPTPNLDRLAATGCGISGTPSGNFLLWLKSLQASTTTTKPPKDWIIAD
jgi:hypothetical protein